MYILKVCFVGIGSIAKRHIKNLKMICETRKLCLRVDAFRHCGPVDPLDGIDKVYNRVEDVPGDYNIIFITNPTELHLQSLQKFHNKGEHFFIEKPVVSYEMFNEAEKFETRSNSIYYVACPLRYNPVIQYIRKNIPIDKIISVRSISSSYLPDWRPGKDYRETYSAHKALGGGVSIDLIHEWDYLTYLFGWPKKVLYMIGKKSTLDIDSDDYAIYLAEYDRQIVELHLDYFGRKTIRKIQLFTEDETIVGDIANNRVLFLTAGKEIDFREDRDDYQVRELEHFLNMVCGLTEQENGYKHSLEVLKLTQGRIK